MKGHFKREGILNFFILALPLLIAAVLILLIALRVVHVRPTVHGNPPQSGRPQPGKLHE